MIAAGSPFQIDPEQYQQAVGVLERDALSPRDERWFERLNRLTWAALILSASWLPIVFLAPSAQVYVLIATTACYLTVVPLSLVNGPLFWKLFKAKRRERALQLTRPLGAIAAREPGARLRNVANGVILLVAGVMFLLGAIGFSVWLDDDNNLIGRLGAIIFPFLGLACVLIYLVNRARRRLRAMRLLRNALDNATDLAIDGVMWDGIVCMERTQIIQDLQATREHTVSRTFPVLRMSDQFSDQLKASDLDDSAAIYAMIRELSHGDDVGAASGTREIRAGLALEYVVDRQRNEIRLQQIVRTERRSDG